MSAKSHSICLSSEEREALEQVSRSGRCSEREKRRARILLLSDENVSREDGGSLTDVEVGERLRCSRCTVYQVRRRAVEVGRLRVVKHGEQRQRKARALDGEGEARLIALACSTPPEGHATWTLRLLRERLIDLDVVPDIALETVRRTLKKTHSSRG